mmetsp:Transcript_543/g.1161  ORF Transcript_543/g.1161 Transcript_543/m.1161 type:complete len:389 (-) Transcript_543:191-1357(-)
MGDARFLPQRQALLRWQHRRRHRPGRTIPGGRRLADHDGAQGQRLHGRVPGRDVLRKGDAGVGQFRSSQRRKAGPVVAQAALEGPRSPPGIHARCFPREQPPPDGRHLQRCHDGTGADGRGPRRRKRPPRPGREIPREQQRHRHHHTTRPVAVPQQRILRDRHPGLARNGPGGTNRRRPRRIDPACLRVAVEPAGDRARRRRRPPPPLDRPPALCGVALGVGDLCGAAPARGPGPGAANLRRLSKITAPAGLRFLREPSEGGPAGPFHRKQRQRQRRKQRSERTVRGRALCGVLRRWLGRQHFRSNPRRRSLDRVREPGGPIAARLAPSPVLEPEPSERQPPVRPKRPAVLVRTAGSASAKQRTTQGNLSLAGGRVRSFDRSFVRSSV